MPTGTAASSLIQSAYREGNLIAVGASPTAAEQTEALDLLNKFVLGIFGYEMGENLQDWLAPAPQRTAPAAADYPQFPLCGDPSFTTSYNVYPYPPRNKRIVWGGTTLTVYFPEKPMDGSRMSLVQGSGAGDGGTPGAVLTLDGNGRTIETLTTKTFVNPAAARQWFYRADLADWQAVVPLLIGDPCPFPPDFDDFFVCALSMRLAPRYSKITAAETQQTALQTLKRLKARYRQAGVTTYGSENYPNSAQSYFSGRPWW